MCEHNMKVCKDGVNYIIIIMSTKKPNTGTGDPAQTHFMCLDPLALRALPFGKLAI